MCSLYLSAGDIEDFPGLDSLPCYQVEVQAGGGVKVRAKKEEVKSSKRIKDMVSRDKAVDTTFVVVGGGEFHSYPQSVYYTICVQNFTYKS
jgi:hypothetical protein